MAVFFFVCLIWFFTSQSTVFQLYWDGSSWVEPVLSKDKCVLLKDTTVTPGAQAPRSRENKILAQGKMLPTIFCKPFKNDYSTEYLYLWLVSKTITKTFQRNSVICCATALGIMNINCRFSPTVRKSTLYNSREQNICIVLLHCTCTGHVPLLMHGYCPLYTRVTPK